MVLHKRKTVDFIPIPRSLENTTDQSRKSTSSRTSLSRTAEITDEPCWEIERTGELFADYEEYLARQEFYKRKIFTCEISGRTGLDFYEALNSEINGSKEIQDAFPESLRRPVLNLVQHRVEQRLEQLVNTVYDAFNDNYFPGELVHISRVQGEALEGKIREKTILGDGIPRYTISVASQTTYSSKDIQVEGGHIRRERRNFNKQLLRSFLRDSLTKEAWHGSPWCVKTNLALKYDLATQVPANLQHSVVTEKRKQEAQQKRALQQQSKEAHKSMGIITDFRQYPSSKKNGPAPPHLPSGPGVMQPVWSSKPGAKQKQHKFVPAFNGANGQQFIQFNGGQDLRMSHYAPNGNGEAEPMLIGLDGVPHFPNGTVFQTVDVPVITKEEEKPMARMIKWPVEDLEVPTKTYHVERPALKTFTDLKIAGTKGDEECPTGKYDTTSIGPLLEVWNTLNVHSEVFVLDSFTFDDFVQAVRYSSPDHTCELLAEAHCAVLKQFVDENGKILVDLPPLHEDSESSKDSEEEEESSEEEEDSPEPEPARRATRASLRKEELVIAKEKSPTPNPYAHRGEEYQAASPWKERCKDREFAHNAWLGVLVGFLYNLSLVPFMKTRCDKILCELLPLDEEPTDEVIMENYRYLDVNLRLQALEIITKMTIGTAAIREHLDRMTQEMTDLRKKRIDQQRARKEYIEELHKLNTQRKELMAEIEEKKTPEEKAKEAAEAAEAAAEAEADDDDTPMPDLSLVNGNVSDSELSEEGHRPLRKRKRTEDSSTKNKAKLKVSKTRLSKEQTALAKVEDEMNKKKEAIKDCEEKVEDVTNDLRETDCQRTRCLGKDRFCNRYWWFERNGMPYGGVPSSSTADYGFANARIWVQGPDKYDLTDMFDLSKEDEALYKSMHGVSVKDRRIREEGATQLLDANYYGYIDTPEELEQLLQWLDERGHRERALKKEFFLWREIMVDCMSKLKKHHAEDDDKQDEDIESGKPLLRVSTRTKNYADLEIGGWKCLKWQNSAALDQFEQKHSEGTKKKAARKGVAERKVVEKKAPEKKVVEKKVIEKKAAPPKKVTERKASTRKTAPPPEPTPESEEEPAPLPTKRGSSRIAKVAAIEVEKRGGRLTRRTARA